MSYPYPQVRVRQGCTVGVSLIDGNGNGWTLSASVVFNALDSSTLLSPSASSVLSSGEESIEEDEHEEGDERQSSHRDNNNARLRERNIDTS